VVLIIALYTLPISGKTVKQTATTTTTTTTLVPTNKILATTKVPVKGTATKIEKKKKKAEKKRYQILFQTFFLQNKSRFFG
jgi:hypothetical protein